MVVQYSKDHSLSNHPGHNIFVSQNFFKFMPVVGIVEI